MKKRIGTKVYDTETAELVSASALGNLYRKRTRAREWFLINDGNILPMTDREARAMLGENTYIEKEPETNSIMIRVDRQTHAVIAEKARKDGVSITEEMRRITKNML